MIIPLRTDRTPRRRPLVTEVLIVVNMLVFLAGLMVHHFDWFDLDELIEFGHLWRLDFHIWQPITYQFLHDPGSIWHLAFNMLFLWIFGCAVEDRLGRLSFLCFYLIGGIVSGLAHMALDPHPVIGASGAIAGVTGGFLALFPRSRILVIVFFVLVAVPSLWFIGLYFALDVLSAFAGVFGRGERDVAYSAHLAGYLYGFGTAFLLLVTHIVKREEFDVFSLFRQARRRAAFRSASRGQTGGLYESASADTRKQLERQQKKDQRRGQSDEEGKLAQTRLEIMQLLRDHQLPEAAARYRDLLDQSPESVFPEPQQLDLGNQLHTQGDHSHAALAYELLLHHHPRCSSAAEVNLLLGVLLGRHLHQPERALPFVRKAMDTLTEPGQKDLARQLHAELEP